MNPTLITALLLLSLHANATYSYGTKCISPVEHPFEASEKFEVETLETREIGIFGYLTGAHKDMIQKAQTGISSRPIMNNGCAKSSSLVLFMEPAEYSGTACSKNGALIQRAAQVQVKGKFSKKKAMKAATKWFADTISADYPECPSSCSFASTTKLTVMDNELLIQSAMKCVTKRVSKVNLVHTAFLHEWACDH